MPTIGDNAGAEERRGPHRRSVRRPRQFVFVMSATVRSSTATGDVHLPAQIASPAPHPVRLPIVANERRYGDR